MKHLWRLLAASGVLVLGACADGTTTSSPEATGVPANIAVPRLRNVADGQLTLDGQEAKRIIDDSPVTGCYDVCSGDPGGDPGGSTGTSADTGSAKIVNAVFTEAHFEGDLFKGHAEMSYVLADHATQDMTLTTARQDGSTLGSYKYSTAKTWALPVPFAQEMNTNGTMPAPQCDGRGTGITIHEVWSSVAGRGFGSRATSQTPVMRQSLCTAGSGAKTSDGSGSGTGGGLRICLRVDHYSRVGEYVYTETIYCYDVNAA